MPQKTSAPVTGFQVSSRFIAGPVYDTLFFIATPLIALLLGVYVEYSSFFQQSFSELDPTKTLANIFIGTIIFSHLFAVFFRSHGNQTIFRRFPLRFTLVPITLFVAMIYSPLALVTLTVLASFWDVWHSGQQTFGLGRIYDMRAGQQDDTGRTLDIIFNFYIYSGPIIGGVSLYDHLINFSGFESAGIILFSSIPAFGQSLSRELLYLALGTGIPFLIYYVYRYWQFYRQGYPLSIQKLILLVNTATVSIIAWGFNTWGEAFFIMNFFHAVQYYAIVWLQERKNMEQRVSFLHSPFLKKMLALMTFFAIIMAYGMWESLYAGNSTYVFALFTLVSILHFWYDSFIWSVQRKDI